MTKVNNDITPMPQQVVEAPTETPKEQVTAPERTTPKFIEEYVPGALRQPTIRSTVDTTAPSLWEGTKAVIDDSGLASNVGRVYDDFTQDEDQDFHVMQAALPSMLTKYDVNEAWSEQLLLQAKNTQHMETLVQRIQRVTAHRKGADAMGIPKMLATEIGGFVLDPTNFIPGTLVVKGASLTSKALPKVAATMARLHGSKMGTMGIYAAFGATEEAIRLSPRLMSDPTYNYEQYLMEVGTGAVFAGAIPAVPTAYRWSKSVIAKPARKLEQGMRNACENYGKSVETRTGVNVMKQAVKGSRKAAKDKNIKAVFDEVDTAKATREARDDFNKSQRDSEILKRVQKATGAVEDKLKKAEIDELEGASAYSKGVQSILDAALPKGSALRKGLDKFNDFIDGKNAKADAERQSVGASKREPAKGQRKEDLIHDIKTEMKQSKETFKKAMDDIEETRKAAMDAIGEGTDKVSAKAREAIESATLHAQRAVEAQAARRGVKVQRRAATKEAFTSKTRERYTNTTGGFNRLGKKMHRLLKGKLSHAINKDELTRALNKALDSVGIDMIADDSGIRKHVIDWINSDPSKAAVRAQKVREAITRAYDDLAERLEDTNTGNPADKEFLQAKRIIAETKDEMEALIDWTGMVNDSSYVDLVNLDPRWALLSKEYETALGAETREAIHKAYNSMAQRAVSNQFGTLTQSLGTKLFRSRVPLAEWMAMNILEMPAGTGGVVKRSQTAAVVSQIMQAEIEVPLNKAYFDMMSDAAKELGYGRMKRLMLRMGNANHTEMVRDINQQIMLEMNARQLGKQINSPSYVTKFADELQIANDKLYDLQLNNKVDGITGHNKMKNYMRQNWNDSEFMNLVNDPDVGREGVIQVLTKSMTSRAGSSDVLSDQAARDFAEAIVNLKLQGLRKPQVSRTSLASDMEDTLADIFERMNKAGQHDSIEQIMKWNKSDTLEAAGYTQKRHIKLDYSAKVNVNGRTVSVMELLDNDVIGAANRYSKEAAGRSAISQTSGFRLNSEAAIDDFIGAMAVQAGDLGTYVNTKEVRNVFRQMMGLPFDGQLPMDVRRIRDAVSLAGMNGLGESQLAEFGLAANRGLSGLFGMHQVMSKHMGKTKQFVSKWKPMKLTDKQKTDMAYLNELQEISRLYEESHIMARNNVHFDTQEPKAAQSAMSKVIDAGTGGQYRPVMQYLQTRYTYYSAIRVMEEQVAMAGLMRDAMKFITKSEGATSKARFNDIGLDLPMLKRKLDQGIIELLPDGSVKTMNLHRWSKMEQQDLAVALRRHSGQQVQLGFAGEMSPLMTDPRVAMLMQFKQYPALAAEKQMGRNLMFSDREAAMGIALNGASSAAARMIRYYSLSMALPVDKREGYLDRRMENDFNHDTLAYMGIVGMMVNNYDLVDDLALGNGSVAEQIPVVNWAANYLKAVKSANPIGGIDERDVANMQRGAPLGTIADVNTIAGIIRTLMDSPDEETLPPRKNRGS